MLLFLLWTLKVPLLFIRKDAFILVSLPKLPNQIYQQSFGVQIKPLQLAFAQKPGSLNRF